MKLLIPLGKRNVQAGSSGTERSDPAHQLCVISVSLHTVLQIGKSGVYTRISKCQEDNVFALVKTGFQSFGSLCVVFFEFFCVVCHWHVDRKKFFVG